MNFKHHLLNHYNYLYLFKIFYIFGNPILFIYYALLQKAPERITIRTPIGKLNLYLRNFESLKTVFSIFCREDYKVSDKKGHFIDLGSNCGYSSIYFLSRNNLNTIDCYEPEEENIKFLRKNLKVFSKRSNIHQIAVGTIDGEETFYTSEDGKYSSLIKRDTLTSYKVKVVPFISIIKEVGHKTNTQIKIDIEGLEEKIIKDVDFTDYKSISKLIIESKNCSLLIKKNHKRLLINGYVEHIYFN